jgi:putative transposase
MVQTISFRRGRLPHWTVAERAYFVTISQKGAIPADRLAELAESSLVDADRFLAIDKLLDSSPERCRVLHRAPLAERLLSALEWLESEKKGWVVHAVCIMPSHIHLVMRNGVGRSGELGKDLAAFKNFTARICNTELSRSGRFWAKESFDHWCRDEDSVRKAVAYTLRNPVRAGLVSSVDDWPWVKVGAEYADFAQGL